MAEGAAGQARLRMAGAAIYNITTGLSQDGRGWHVGYGPIMDGIGFMQRIGCAARAEARLNLFLTSVGAWVDPTLPPATDVTVGVGESYRSDGGWRLAATTTMPLRALANGR